MADNRGRRFARILSESDKGECKDTDMKSSSVFFIASKKYLFNKMQNRKEISRQYKAAIQPMGVYRIKNSANGKIFVASSKQVDKICNRELFQLRNGLHLNKEMQQDFNQHGEQNFTFEVLEYLEPDKEQGYDYSFDLKTLEEKWLEKLKPYGPAGYNEMKK